MKWWRKQTGFTVIELVVVMIIIGILTGIAVNRFGSAEVDARDTERKADVDTLARHFETVFSKTIRDTSDVVIKQNGSYPSTVNVSRIEVLDGLDSKALRAPGINQDQPVSLINANNNNKLTSGIDPQPTVDEYVYQPLNNSGNVCTTSSNCRSFNIFYKTESDDIVRKISSRRQ